MGTNGLPDENRLRLLWLGTPLVSHAGHPLTFRTRKALALLIYLTVEGGSHTREKLVDLFWSESNATKGRGMLRTTLAYLREALAGVEASHLKITAQTLGFDFSSDFTLDLQSLQAGLDLIQRPPELATRAEDMLALQQIAAGYRGDFLEGFSLADAPAFDDWATLQREICHRRMSLIFDTLSQWQFEAGDLPAALETAARWKAHDLYSESAPHRLMQLHFANNDRNAALQVYDAYAKMLDVEFGDKPSSEINELAARIRTSAMVRRPDQRAQPTPPSADLAFVGRATELAHLRAAYEAAAHGEAQSVILVGESGIGKTRLTTEFLQWAWAHGADILSGRSFETGGQVAYQPVAQLLRHRLEQEPSLAELLSPTWLAELSRLLPEVRDRVADLPQPQADEATAQSRLLESIARLGEALAARAPLLLFIDDIQWADTSSLDTLYYAMARWTEHKVPVLLLLCTRNIPSGEKGNLRQWLSGLAAKLSVAQLELRPLTAEDTLTLLASLEKEETRSRPDTQNTSRKAGAPRLASASSPALPRLKAFAQALFAETGGQPLYLVETIKTLLEQKVLIPYQSELDGQGVQWGTLTGDTSGQFPLPRIIPNTVRSAILDRLSRLTAPATAMLSAAAVLGQAASFSQLAAISGLEQMVGLDALEELTAKRMLVEADQLGQNYVIAHDTTREVAYAGIGAARRQVLHSRAVTAMHGSDPARLAYHARSAGMDAEAFHYSLVAADAALHLLAASEAITHFENARKILAAGKIPPVELAQLQHLYLGLGYALGISAQFELANAIYEELKTIARQRAAPAVELAALVAQTKPWLSTSFNRTQAEAHAQEALHLARTLGDQVAEIDILCRLAEYYRHSSHLSEAIRCADQALTLARRLNLRAQTADILDVMVKVHAYRGRLDLAEQAQREALDLWRELDDLPMVASSLGSLAFLGRWTGKYEQALAHSAEVNALNESFDNVWIEAYSHFTLGYIYWERGEAAQAIATMEGAIRLAEKATYLPPQILTRADLGNLYITLGDHQRGFETMHQALELANTRLPTYRVYVVGLLARQYLRQNNLEKAAAIITQEKQEGTLQPFTFLSQWLCLAEAELALRQADTAHALALADEILSATHQSGICSLLPTALYLRGECLVALGRQAEAHAALLEARTAAELIGSRWMLGQILPLLASIESVATQAEQFSQQAAAHQAYILDHTPPKLRAILLTSPQ